MPRPQPYGLSEGRGDFERSRGSRSHRRPAVVAAAVAVLGAAKATTPPTLTQANTGSTLVIPVPSEALVGGRLLAVVQGISGVAAWTSPAGWTLLAQDAFDRWRIETRVVQSGDPSSYTWTYSQDRHSRSGCMIALSPCTVGDSAIANDDIDPFGFPAVTAVGDGALFLGLIACQVDDWRSEAYVGSAPLSLETQHVARGDRSYQFAVSTALLTEAGVSGLVSGREVSNPQGSNAILASLILEVA